jgi:MinD-like ATPase involved in chromosome partitioning or flagellar assembly
MGICAIWGAPHSGKTTLAVNLAYAVSRGEQSVCLISPAPYSELSALLGVTIPEDHSLRAALQGRSGIKQTVHKVDELFFVLAAPTSADAFEDDYTGEQVKTLLALVGSTFDAVVVDCPSGTDNLFAAWTLNKSDTVVVCLGGQTSCAVWHTAYRRAIQSVEHKSVYACTETAADFDYGALCALMNRTPDVRIPYVREAAALQNEAGYLYDLPGRRGWSYAKAINELYGVIGL